MIILHPPLFSQPILFEIRLPYFYCELSHALDIQEDGSVQYEQSRLPILYSILCTLSPTPFFVSPFLPHNLCPDIREQRRHHISMIFRERHDLLQPRSLVLIVK